jgi:hypothetical protein
MEPVPDAVEYEPLDTTTTKEPFDFNHTHPAAIFLSTGLDFAVDAALTRLLSAGAGSAFAAFAAASMTLDMIDPYENGGGVTRSTLDTIGSNYAFARRMALSEAEEQQIIEAMREYVKEEGGELMDASTEELLIAYLHIMGNQPRLKVVAPPDNCVPAMRTFRTQQGEPEADCAPAYLDAYQRTIQLQENEPESRATENHRLQMRSVQESIRSFFSTILELTLAEQSSYYMNVVWGILFFIVLAMLGVVGYRYFYYGFGSSSSSASSSSSIPDSVPAPAGPYYFDQEPPSYGLAQAETDPTGM